MYTDGQHCSPKIRNIYRDKTQNKSQQNNNLEHHKKQIKSLNFDCICHGKGIRNIFIFTKVHFQPLHNKVKSVLTNFDQNIIIQGKSRSIFLQMLTECLGWADIK